MRVQFFIGFGILFIFLFIFGLRFVNDFFEGEDILPRFFFSQVSPAPNEALFFVSPATGTHNVSDTFQVDLRLGASEEITSIRGYLDYDLSLIAVAGMETSSTAFSAWWEDTFDNVNGKLRFQASAPVPGLSGNNLLIAQITFQAMGEGTVNLTYDASSLALKADDTDILNIAGSETGAYTFAVSETPPPTPPPPPPSGGGGGTSSSSPASTAGLAGDCNGDGKVNIFDFSILLSNWQKTTGTCDLNGDGVINIFDLSILLSNWAP